MSLIDQVSKLGRALIIIAGLLSTSRAQTPLSPRSGATTYDNVVDFSYAGRAAIGEGSRPLGEIDSAQTRVSLVNARPLYPDTTLVTGVGAQWLEFHPPAGSPVPERLGCFSLKLGLNRQLDPSWSLRAEADPGIYGDFAGRGGDFGAPVALRFVYAASRELQWAFGVNYDWRSGHPLIGGVGVRWQVAPDWTLAFLLPAPRVDWAVTKSFGLFAGASLRGGTFRVADDFGRVRGRPELDRQIVDYREIAVGAGARWQLSRVTALHLAVGRMLDRRFEFHDRNLLLNGDGAATGQLTMTSAF